MERYQAVGGGSGAVLIATGVLGLRNLAGAGGPQLFILQAFPLVAVIAGLGLLYGATQSPAVYRRVVSYVLAGSAVVVLGVSAISTYSGFTGTSPLARLFLWLGIVGTVIGLTAASIAWRLRFRDPEERSGS